LAGWPPTANEAAGSQPADCRRHREGVVNSVTAVEVCSCPAIAEHA
jgi:hypothetical protein